MWAAAFLAGAVRFTFWVEPCTRPEATLCRPADVRLPEWALAAWARESGGRLRFQRVTARDEAQIRFEWAEGARGLYGEAQIISVAGKRGAIIRLRPDPTQFGAAIEEAARSDALLRDVIVYLTCLHEAGHALGLRHTAQFADIMYSFGFGGDIGEYFARYRRQLRRRDGIRKQSGISANDRQRLLAALGTP